MFKGEAGGSVRLTRAGRGDVSTNKKTKGIFCWAATGSGIFRFHLPRSVSTKHPGKTRPGLDPGPPGGRCLRSRVRPGTQQHGH